MRFSEKVVIVTGGSSGIGKAAVLEFLKEGALVVIASRGKKKAEETLAEFAEYKDQLIFVQTDISSEPSVENMVETTIRVFGRVDILVNNAASFIAEPADTGMEQWEESLKTDIIGVAMSCKYALREMEKTGGGAIVNVSSISGVIAQKNLCTYNTTKAALINMTRCMALDYAEKNIRVNCVSPGIVITEHQHRFVAKQGKTMEQAKKEWGPLHVLNRLAEPREIARPILFLASDDDASFITGENLMVDGGYTIV